MISRANHLPPHTRRELGTGDNHLAELDRPSAAALPFWLTFHSSSILPNINLFFLSYAFSYYHLTA
jgi:hypothetical protein